MPPTEETSHLPPVSDDLPPVSDDSVEGPVAEPSPRATVPAQIGRYRILGVLGSGGMGVVYTAEQDNPRRQVALKVMKAGTANAKRLRRFEHEAQALARLEHPGIARIYEADTGEGTEPYFAMELIQGQPITAYADAKQLGVADRVRLLIAVCEAVEFAHRQGVTHRDLKPGNILVGADGRPKVLDFGVARLAASDLPAEMTLTDVGDLVGTPQYMSPEQAAADPELVDWRTDIYALGVIAYELLAGRLPHDLRGKSYLAIAQTIREEEPTSLGSINKAFRGDLDTIIAKAMEKEKTRRYQSAAELAEDLACYLDDKPVKARPAGSLYQLRKFARRHRALVGSVVGVVLALVIGTVAAAWWAVAAGQAEKKAQNYLADARAAQHRSEDLLAESYEQAARLASQRGAWREAIAFTDKALATDRYRDSVPLRLNKVRALLAVDDKARYTPEIEALAATPNLGEHAASVWLIQGDILLWHDEQKAEQLIRRARARGLPPAEDAYAQALLAETMPEAVTHLRRSLELDPYQPRARTVLELLLLTLARLPEARLELSAHEALFPEDGNATVLRAMVLALQGDLPTANAVLDRLRGRAADADLAGYRQLLGLLAELPRPENAPDPDRGAPELVRHLLAAAPGLVRLWHAERGEDKPGGLFGATQSFFHNLPLPFLVRRMAPHLRRAVENLPNGLPNEVALREMAWVARVHPEGTILYYRALMLLGTFQWAAAEKAALEAAHAPALLHVRPHALNIAITAEGMRYAMSRDPNVLRVALANLRELRTLGPYRFPKPQIPVGLAMRAGDWNLARELLDEWRLREPGNGERPWWRAHVEFYAGNPVAALAAVDRALKTKPRDVALLNIRNAAAAQLREQVGRLFLRSPDNFFRACGTTWVGLLGSPAGSLLVVATLPVKIPAKN